MKKATVGLLFVICFSVIAANPGFCGRYGDHAETIKAVQKILEKTQESIPGLVAQGFSTEPMNDAQYRAFTQSINERKKLYRELLAVAQGLDAGDSEVLRNLKVDVIRLIGLRRTLDMTYLSCMQARHFSYPDNINNACFKPAIAPVAQDYSSSQDRIRATLSALASGGAGGGDSDETKAPAGPAPEQPNIIIVLIDALRADAVGAYGGAHACHTPAMDKLARNGVLFKHITSAASTTTTSVAALFAGKNPYAIHASGNRLWDYSQSLIPVFRDNGYFTFGISANSLIWPENQYDVGFKLFFGRYWSNAGIMVHELDSCLTAMHDLPQPFFLYLHLVDPHDPYFAPDKAEQPFYHKPRQGFEVNPNAIRDKYIDSNKDPAASLPDGNIEYLKQLYCDEVSYADRHVGDLVSLLENHGMLENTLVIITADHGEEFLEHGDLKHSRQLYQELVHVPLIFWGKLPPALKPGATMDQPHSQIHLLPSLLAWLGIHSDLIPPGNPDLFSNKKPDYPIISTAKGLSFDRKHRDSELAALRYGDIKCIMDLTRDNAQLFHLSKDPGESRDLSDRFSYQIAAMRVQIDEIRGAGNASGGAASPAVDEANEKLKKQLKSLGYLK